jgi:hypothetical protein
MPETAVNKDRDLWTSENEIGFTINGCISSPASDAVFAHERDEGKFGRPVSTRPYQRHDSAALRFGEDIRHLQTGLRRAIRSGWKCKCSCYFRSNRLRGNGVNSSERED